MWVCGSVRARDVCVCLCASAYIFVLTEKQGILYERDTTFRGSAPLPMRTVPTAAASASKCPCGIQARTLPSAKDVEHCGFIQKSRSQR